MYCELSKLMGKIIDKGCGHITRLLWADRLTDWQAQSHKMSYHNLLQIILYISVIPVTYVPFYYIFFTRETSV